MNKHIAKLANQSGFDVDNTGKFGNYSEMHRLEKFAELIVRECINEVHGADVGDLKAKGYYLDKVAEHLERQFGVKQ